MTDLEITRLCAEAMNVKFWLAPDHPDCEYAPLHDDAQAMALVKKFNLELRFNSARVAGECWVVTPSYEPEPFTYSDNLNRAICKCVAVMQKNKAA